MEKPFSVDMRNRVVVIEEKKIKNLKNKNEYYYNVMWMYVIKIINYKNKELKFTM